MDLSNLSTDDIAKELGYRVLRDISRAKRLDLLGLTEDGTLIEAPSTSVEDEITARRQARTDEGAPPGA